MLIWRVSFITAFLTLTSCATIAAIQTQAAQIDQDSRAAEAMAHGQAVEKPVVAGQPVAAKSAEAHSAVLLLITRGSSLHACTAVFVAPRVLLTAAHCVEGVSAKQVRIVFQARGLADSSAASDQKPAKIVVHENYDGKPESHSDLALLALSQPPPSVYKPFKLLRSTEKISGDEVLLLGYGITSETNKDSMVLRKTTKSLKTEIHLKDSYFGIDQKSATGGFCRGDSGAPIFVTVFGERRLLGINSFTVGLGKDRECHTASVAMASTHFHAWVENNVSKL